MVIKIGCHPLSLRSVLAVLELIIFERLLESTISVFAELAVMFALDMASQSTESEIVPSQVFRVSLIVPPLSSIARTKRVTLPMPPARNAQIGFMLFSPDSTRRILLIW